MFNMKSFLLIAVLGYIALASCTVSAHHEDIHRINNDHERKRRDINSPFITAIDAGISAGKSLDGTTVEALIDPGYNVATAGSIDNYSKWTMILQKCTEQAGVINVKMVDVGAGKKEGFASHKTGNTAKGTWVYCLYKVDDKRVHIMYSVPYSFDMHSNWLALAITTTNVDLDAEKMYYNDYRYMDRKEYYHSMEPTEICVQKFCIRGSMGITHKPIINIKLYHQWFINVSPSVKESLKDIEEASTKYMNFIQAFN